MAQHTSQISQALKELASKFRRQSIENTLSPVEIEKYWRKADLSYLFWPVQKKMAENLSSASTGIKLLNCSRRSRKTSTALTKATEFALKNNNALIRFAALTQKQVKNIIQPIMKRICEGAPSDLRPLWKGFDGKYYFPSTGSELHIAGCNGGHEDDLLGNASDLCIVDEAQGIKRLKYVVDTVLMPQLLSTNGQFWILMTPPKTPVHECMEYVKEAQAANNYSEYSIYETEYPADRIQKFCEKAGGPESTTWKSQYLCQFVVDTNYSIIPEWKDELAKDIVPDEYTQFYKRYVGLDVGVKDLTAGIYGYYDFKRAALVILDETQMNGPQMTTEKLAAQIKAKEKELKFEGLQTPNRISDNALQLVQDLGSTYQLYFSTVRKTTLDAMINNLRVMVAAGRIIVSPRCKGLIGCLKYGVWNNKRDGFDRSEELGHFDHLAALIYLALSIDQTTNPIPKDFGIEKANYFRDPRDKSQLTTTEKAIKNIFSGGRRK